MREYENIFDDGLVKGLRSTSKNMRNTQRLIKADGMFPEEGVLRAVESVTSIPGLTALGLVFPFPQLHVGQVHTIIMGPTEFWEYKSGVLTSVISGLTNNGLWTVADFYDYILITNGIEMVRRDAESHSWEVYVDENVPVSRCVAAVNGQLIVGSPDVLL